MEYSPSWNADSRSDSQKNPCLLCNLIVHYRVNNSPMVISETLESKSQPHIYFFEISFNIISKYNTLAGKRWRKTTSWKT